MIIEKNRELLERITAAKNAPRVVHDGTGWWAYEIDPEPDWSDGVLVDYVIEGYGHMPDWHEGEGRPPDWAITAILGRLREMMDEMERTMQMIEKNS